MRTIKKIGSVVQCDIDMWVPGATTLTLARGTIIFDSFGQVGTIKISDIDLAACDPVITDGTDEEIFEQVVDFFSVSHGVSVTVDVNGVDMATSSSNISLGLVFTDDDPVPFVKDGLNMVVEKSGYPGRPVAISAQLAQVVAGDCGAASVLGAYSCDIPRHGNEYNELDPTDPTGATLLHDSISFNSKARFTSLSGVPNTYTSISYIDGLGVSRGARALVDNYYGEKGIILILTDDTGRWGVEWISRMPGATYNGSPIYPLSRGMLAATQLFSPSSNCLEAYMGHVGLVYSGESPQNATGSTYSMTGTTLGLTAKNTNLKLAAFQKIL